MTEENLGWTVPIPKWHANPRYGNFDYRHPELQDGEVLLYNASHASFAELAWESKRQGGVAYSIFGKDITDKKPGGFRPVFIAREELERRGLNALGGMQPDDL